MKSPELQIEEVGKPITFKWNKCKLETTSYGHGITTTPLQAAAAYASISNGGYIVKPTLKKLDNGALISKEKIVSKSQHCILLRGWVGLQLKKVC